MNGNPPPGANVGVFLGDYQRTSSLFLGFVYAAAISLVIRAAADLSSPLRLWQSLVVLGLILFIVSDAAIRYRVRHVIAGNVKAWQGIFALLFETATIYYLSMSLVSFILGMRPEVGVHVLQDVRGYTTCYAAFSIFAFLSWAWNLLLVPAFGTSVPSLVKALFAGNALELESLRKYLKSARDLREKRVNKVKAVEAKWEASRTRLEAERLGGRRASERHMIVIEVSLLLRSLWCNVLGGVDNVVDGLFSVVAQAVAVHVTCASLCIGALLFISDQLRGGAALLPLPLNMSSMSLLLQIVCVLVAVFLPGLAFFAIGHKKWKWAGAIWVAAGMLLAYTTLTSFGLIVVLMLQQVASSTIFQVSLPHNQVKPAVAKET